MSSTSSAESADLVSGSKEPECEQSPFARSSHFAERCSESDGHMYHASTISPGSASSTSVISTSSAVASPAKTSRSQETGPVSPASDLAYGSRCEDAFAHFDPASSSWKTQQACLISEWKPLSGTWPRSGMMLSGIASRLPPLVQRIRATGSGLLPTIVASDGLTARSITSNTRAKSFRTSTGSWRYRSNGRESSNLMLTRSLALELEYLTGVQQGPLMLARPFAENYMGFPITWTLLKHSATRSSRKSRKSSDGQS
ncbi:hypothetical protein FBZ96_11926 [Bradyrhizobium stylosanthis]|uniref:Uncharacterized protein n=1 Tax=Bradyrhizobium stylosanthis TaxID=1803665 RepID=A0A560CXG7_9BRAD|nr:hypothetical protein FBZ96_11926 [Bradyrhizobium stylosanthis]